MQHADVHPGSAGTTIIEVICGVNNDFVEGCTPIYWPPPHGGAPALSLPLHGYRRHERDDAV
jgi:hypothetical protein